jgi:rubrerythrin
LDGTVDRIVRRQIVRQDGARAFALSAYADAESSGEGQVFERALRRAKDPKVARMIRRHEADEVRHAAMFTTRREELGLPKHTIPARLKMVECLGDTAGGIWDLEMDKDADVVQVYQLLFVVEERALAEFSRAEAAFREAGDKGTADLFAAVALDETRHLAYCRAVGSHYEASPGEFEAGLDAMRAHEAKEYGAQSRAFTQHLLDQGLLKLSGLSAWLVPLLLGVSRALRTPAPAARLLLAA